MERNLTKSRNESWLLGCVLTLLVPYSFGQVVPFGPVDVVSRDYIDQPVQGGINAAFYPRYTHSSRDGHRIAFVTDIGIDPLDTNGTYDIYLRDTNSDQTYLITKDGSGNALGSMINPILSADGQAMACEGTLPSVTPQQGSVFYCDISNPDQPAISPVTYRYDGGPLLSGVSLASASESLDYVFVATTAFLTAPLPGDSQLGNVVISYRISTSNLVPERLLPPCSPFDFSITVGDVSNDGRFASFDSLCPGLVPNDPLPQGVDIFVKDFVTSEVFRVTETNSASGSPTSGALRTYIMSGDSTVLVFRGNYQYYLGANAPSGSGLIWRNRITGETRRVNTGQFLDQTLWCQQLSADGSRALISGFDPVQDRYLTVISDMRGGHWQEVSRGPDGAPLGLAGVPYVDAGFFPNHWTGDERFVVGVIQSVPQDHSILPPYLGETQIARIDLGPGRNLGGFVAGAAGAPEFRLVQGLLSPGIVHVVMERLPPSSMVLLGLGSTLSATPFLGGTAWIWPPESVTALNSDSSGLIVFPTPIPPGLPLGFQLVGQLASPDPTAPFGAVLSNGLLFRLQ